MNKSVLISVLVIACASAACGKKKKENAPPGTVELPTLGLQIDLLSTSAKIVESSSFGTKGVDIMSRVYDDDITIARREFVPSTEEATRPDPYYNEREFNLEKLADGFVVTKRMTYKTVGERYSATAYRKIGGTDFYCSGAATTPAKRQDIIAACKSLAAK